MCYSDQILNDPQWKKYWLGSKGMRIPFLHIHLHIHLLYCKPFPFRCVHWNMHKVINNTESLLRTNKFHSVYKFILFISPTQLWRVQHSFVGLTNKTASGIGNPPVSHQNCHPHAAQGFEVWKEGGWGTVSGGGRSAVPSRHRESCMALKLPVSRAVMGSFPWGFANWHRKTQGELVCQLQRWDELSPCKLSEVGTLRPVS